MYVCVCNAISDRQIKAAIDDGATSVAKLRKTLGVASQCGKCVAMTREILDESLSEAKMGDAIPQFYALA
jgi:bacterioferritin-associated ferredoxin